MLLVENIHVPESSTQTQRWQVLMALHTTLKQLWQENVITAHEWRQISSHFNPMYMRTDDQTTYIALRKELLAEENQTKAQFTIPHVRAAINMMGALAPALQARAEAWYPRSDKYMQLIIDTLAILALFPNAVVHPTTGKIIGSTSAKVNGQRSGPALSALHQILTINPAVGTFDEILIGAAPAAPFDHQDYKGEMMKPKVRSYLAKLLGLATIRVQSNHLQAQPIDPADLHTFASLLPGLYLARNASANGVFILSFIRGTTKKSVLKPLRRLFPSQSVADERHLTTRIDALVHKYMSMSSHWVDNNHGLYMPVSQSARKTHINKVFSMIPVGSPQVLVCATFISKLGAKDAQPLWQYVAQHKTLMCYAERQQKWLKVVGTLMRRCKRLPSGQTLTDEQVAASAYMEMAFGRSGNVSDWVSEEAHRCNLTHHIRAPGLPELNTSLSCKVVNIELGSQPKADDLFYRLLAGEIRKIVPLLIDQRSISEPWDRFVQRRHEWIASGSASGAKLDVTNLIQEGSSKGARAPKLLHINKRAWGEMTRATSIVDYLRKERPREHAVASEKFENGKSRAIYGVDPWHYAINTYATVGMEERLHKVNGLEKGATGLKEVAFAHQKMLITDDPTNECTMLDYADFNIHHTPAAQALLFREIRLAGARAGACADWIAATHWLERSKYNMTVRFPKKQFDRKITQGMFSGTRSTDLINTILNLAYFQVANSFLKAQGLYPDGLYHSHQGDDVWLSNTDPLWAQMIYQVLTEQGFIFQNTKQMFGPQRGEFLRVLYSGGKGLGYLNRSTVNFLLRPVQARLNLDPIAWAQTIDEGCKTMVRRGLSMSMARVIWFDATNFWVKVVAHKDDNAPIIFPRHLLSSPPEVGGLGVSVPGTVYRSTSLVTIPTQTAALKGVKWDELPSHMTRDWISYVSSMRTQQPRQLRAEALKDAIVQENFTPDLSTVARNNAPSEFKKAMARLTKNSSIKKAAETIVSGVTECLDVLSATLPKSIYGASESVAVQMTRVVDAACLAPKTSAPLEDLSDSLRRYIARNRFKSDSRLAAAYGISRTEAMTIIISEAASSPTASDETVAIVSQLIALRRLDLIDVLLSGGRSMYSVLQYWSDSHINNVINAAMHQKLVKGALMYDRYNTGANWFILHAAYIDTVARVCLMTKFKADQLLY